MSFGDIRRPTLSILIDEKTRLLVQVITGGEGSFHTKEMYRICTKIASGMTPGKGWHGSPGCSCI